MDLETLFNSGLNAEVLLHKNAEDTIQAFIESKLPDTDSQTCHTTRNIDINIYVGLAALHAFLQANVTGPVLESSQKLNLLFKRLQPNNEGTSSGLAPDLRQACISSLVMDGVSIYPYAQHIELFCLARWIFLSNLSGDSLPRTTGLEVAKGPNDDGSVIDPAERSLEWIRLRINTWHYKLLAEPNPGPGSVFNKITQWSELPSLQELIEKGLHTTDTQIFTSSDSSNDGISWSTQDKVQFLVEKANIYAMLGQDVKAQEALNAAAKLGHFEYALSGALGKRTRFQEKSTSQLVILARSAHLDSSEANEAKGANAAPQALSLNDDTLLEDVDFTDSKNDSAITNPGDLPEALQNLSPDNQPQLSPLDQIILLSAATLKDAFSPTDSLTLEQILPYATRVLSDKVTNWQIYSQALIVRSRIELHRSRTVERGVLQMQAVVDQVVVNTSATAETSTSDETSAKTLVHDTSEVTVPSIKITALEGVNVNNVPTSFFPAAKRTEQAPAAVRLRYINALFTPPLWHLESELAFAWAGVGSLVSALNIFKRLRLWTEVALCLAGNSTVDDEGGKGARGEEKARGLLRWQLFHASDSTKELEAKAGNDGEEVDVFSLRASDFTGPERNPLPFNAPRMLCILGDIESEPKHYERAWELSNHRYFRAQRSLGEYYLQQRDWIKARDAYKKAVSANRLNTQLWGRLGDIHLRLGEFSDAVEAFGRAISGSSDAVGGEDARTWSNLGSALYSLYIETKKEQKERGTRQQNGDEDTQSVQNPADTANDKAEDEEAKDDQSRSQKDPVALLTQSLAAYKRGASIAHDNWRIWDNVVTLASRVRPPVVTDIVLALRNIIFIRNTEEAVDIDVLRLLLNEAVLSKPKPIDGRPAHGTIEKAVCDLVETNIVPLITTRGELWELVTRKRVWCGDLAGAIDAAEKGWRATTAAAGSGLVGPAASRECGNDDERNWLENVEAWNNVVARTDELVSALENYGPDVPAVGSRWKMKARSALRSVMGKGRDRWEGSSGWMTLENLLEGLK